MQEHSNKKKANSFNNITKFIQAGDNLDLKESTINGIFVTLLAYYKYGKGLVLNNCIVLKNIKISALKWWNN